jgi:hypothetical protein
MKIDVGGRKIPPRKGDDNIINLSTSSQEIIEIFPACLFGGCRHD